MASQIHDAHPPQAMRWPKSLYYQMAEMGWFNGKRVELIRGEIIERTALGTLHFMTVGMVIRVLTKVFDEPFLVAPGVLDLTPDTEPEPDLGVFAQDLKEMARATSRTAVLVVEVADSSLKFDRTVKAEIYAAAGIPEYWIVNVRKRALEVYRSPMREEPSVRPAHYTSIVSYREGQSLSPLGAPQAIVRVSSLLPPADIDRPN